MIRHASFQSSLRPLALLSLLMLLAWPAVKAADNAAAGIEPGVSTSSAAAPAAPAAVSAPAAPAADAAAPGAPAATPAAAGATAADAAATEAAAAAEADNTRALDERIQGLKQEVVDLNRDLFVLEEELLFPANTQVAVFVSMDIGDFFNLDGVTLKIDNKEVTNYLYTPRETAALLRGGVQRLYVGNLKAGTHELVAFFNGKGPNERNYRRGASLKFEKGVGAKYLELKITDRVRRAQPEFEIKDWE